MLCILGLAASAHAVPTLQVGVWTGAGYAPFDDSGSDEDTAFTSGNPFEIVVAGAYGPNTVGLGGQHCEGANCGRDWSEFSEFQFPNVFDGKGAILLVSVPDNAPNDLSSYNDLKIFVDNGDPIAAFYFEKDNSYFPNEHYPVKSNVSDFLFFDIGKFKDNETVQDFSDSSDNARGEQKTIKITIPSPLSGSLTWMHFDVMALETDKRGQTNIVTTVVNNPGSHDVTWNSDGGSPPNITPEPATMVLLGSGLLGLGWRQRRRSKNR